MSLEEKSLNHADFPPPPPPLIIDALTASLKMNASIRATTRQSRYFYNDSDLIWLLYIANKIFQPTD